MSRYKPDLAKEIPNACVLPFNKPTEWTSIFISLFPLGIFISSKLSNGDPTSFF